MRKLKNQKGQSLFEVIVALGIITLVLITLLNLATLSIKHSTSAKNLNQATDLTQSALEWLRSERDLSWTNFSTNAQTPVWCILNLSFQSATVGKCGANAFIASTVFKREITFGIIDADNIDTTVTTYWNDGSGYHEAKSITTFTNWKGQ